MRVPAQCRRAVRIGGRLSACAVLAGVLAACSAASTTEARGTVNTPVTGSDAPAASAPQAAAAPAQPAVPFDSARAWDHLKQQVAFGPRPAGSPALAECRRYIEAQLKAAGIESREQTFTASTPNGPIAMAN